jgi:hypothetical protein
MTTQSHRRIELSRLAIAGAFLLTGLAGSVQAASAGPPVVDDGGSGDGGTVAADRPIFLEHFGLIPTNGGPGSFAMNPEPDGPTLVGSGSERETVAIANDGPTLVGSGPERETVESTVASGMLDEAARSNDLIAMTGGTTASSGSLDETARSNDLIALSPSDEIDTAADRYGRPH